ncbi:MAG: ABC transporter ATP-binding protein [Eubacteriaceae bacterium]|nr:ABC transporter ATP-binding protein [Eubacteriaceae bacterium]
MSELIRAQGVKKHFKVKGPWGRKTDLYAVDGVDLDISKSETVGIVGESGCGKSTLGRLFLNALPLTEGKICFDGVDVSTFSRQEKKQFRQSAQMVFQDPSSSLNPRRTVLEILLEPYTIHNLHTKQQRIEKISQLCDMVGLPRAYLDRYPHEMSGGQKQRVGIARALALEPKFIVCDEPVSALDVSIQAQVINLLEDIQKQLGLAYLFISHNLAVVEHIANRIGVMYLGKIVELAPAARIYSSCLHPYTQALISAIPVIGENPSARQTLPGEMPSPTRRAAGCPFATRCPEASQVCLEAPPALLEASPGHFVACHLRR